MKMNLKDALEILDAPNTVINAFGYLASAPAKSGNINIKLERVKNIKMLNKWLGDVGEELAANLVNVNLRGEAALKAEKERNYAQRNNDAYKEGQMSMLVAVNRPSADEIAVVNRQVEAHKVLCNQILRHTMGLSPGEYAIRRDGTLIEDLTTGEIPIIDPTQPQLGKVPVHGAGAPLVQDPNHPGKFLDNNSDANDFPLHRTSSASIRVRHEGSDGDVGIARYCIYCGSQLVNVNPPNPMYANGACPNPKCRGYGRPISMG